MLLQTFGVYNSSGLINKLGLTKFFSLTGGFRIKMALDDEKRSMWAASPLLPAWLGKGGDGGLTSEC
jgi:hypothetical protein